MIDLMSVLPKVSEVERRVGLHDYVSIPMKGTKKVLESLEGEWKQHLETSHTPLPITPKEMREYDYKGKVPRFWDSKVQCFNRALDWDNLPKDEGAKNAPRKVVESKKVQNVFDQLESPEMYKLVRRVCTKKVNVIEEYKPYFQLARYQQGDALHPHTDYFGTNKKPEWCLVMNFNFSKDVDHHYFIHQGPDGRMSRMADVSPNHLGFYFLPMWHAVAPLQGKGFRWLMINAYGIEGDPA